MGNDNNKIDYSEHYSEFDVLGAGKIRISNDNKWQCSEMGFSFGVEWGQHGFAGGVISNEEAIKLAKHIFRVNNLNTLLDEQ